jgi:MYXO-CTERM domain-containing protein
MRRDTCFWFVAPALLAACTPEAAPEPPEERVGAAQAFITVDQAVTAGCSTSQVAGLSQQIIAQGNCIEPGAFVDLPDKPNTSVGSAVLPFLEEPARDALVAALDANSGTSMQINSMLRTVAQQYLLYRWYQAGTCGIGLAATPGNSNHETGLAIDIQQYNSWKPILQSHGFTWLGSNDPVHFDYTGPGAVDYRGVDVLAFQQLWNLNHPEAPIDEDGDYGPQTEGALKQAPAEGFAMGATCGDPDPDPDPDPTPGVTVSARFDDAADDFDDGPSAGAADLLEGRSYVVVVDVQNGGTGDAADVELTVTLPDGDLSAGGWTLDGTSDTPASSTFVVPIGALAAGDTKSVEIDVTALRYSVEQPAPLELTFEAGADSATIRADIYSDRRWEWNGGRLEGWEPSDAALDGAVTDDTSLLVEGAGAVRYGLDVPLEGIERVVITATGSIGEQAGISFTIAETADEGRIALDLPADGAPHEVVVDATTIEGFTGTLSSLSLSIGEGSVDSLRLEGPVGPAVVPGDSGGCTCRHAAPESSPRAALALLFLAAAAFARRRQR